VTDPVTGQDDGFLADPGSVIAGIVHDAEPSLDRDVIAAVITRAAPSRAQQRRLAAALSDDPGLLTSGRPEGPPQVELLIRDLQPAGARQLVLPRCAHCGEPRRLVQCDGRLRICSACDRRRRGPAEPCSVCGSARQVAARDQHGRPRCNRCLPYDSPDPVAGIAAHVSRRDPGAVRAGLEDVITSAIPSPFQRHQVLWELDARPALLAGEGAHGSPRVNVLIRALVDAGVPGIVAPACPSCRQAVPLRFRLGEVRCCRRCYDRDRLEICSRCGQASHIASRTPAGDAVCSACFRRDPANHEQCSNCGQTALTVRRDDGTAWCRRCYRVPVATCSLCGRDKPCYLVAAGTPRCEHCSRRMRHAPCARCGNSRAVWTRTADGQPLCGSCSRQRVPCSTCGKTRTVAARLPAGPVCSTCYRKDPASFRPCTACGTTEHLYHHGLCIRCACREHLLGLLSHDQGGMHPHAETVYHMLAASDPAPLMQWLTTSSAAGMLADISRARRPPGHADLDRFPSSKAVRHLRKILVAGGILPVRDERLAELERWAAEKTGQIGDPAERRAVRSFATWHHLRRLRGESARHQITTEQADYVHHEVRAAVTLITWLRKHGTSLASCTQRDIDDWLAAGPGTCFHARTFVAWASGRGHAGDVEIPRPVRSETLAQLEEDRRWELVRSLLHDEARAIEDRVAGLLVLLYGQPLARIARLTRDQVTHSPDSVTLLLGTMPVEMPGPLDGLVRQLLARRHGRAAVGRTSDHPWLFPGGAPAHPISTARLKTRLAAVGIHGRSGRNTALMDLAVKLPPVALARLLGIHINTAGTWAERAGGSHAAYAAQVSRRTFSKF
jgi:hypothetical protein